MFADLPCVKKIPHILPIIPVYFIIIEVLFTVNYYITFNPLSGIIFKSFSLLAFNPLAFMVIVTHTRSMLTNPGYVPIPFKSMKIIDESSKESYCQKCHNPRPPRSHHCKICNKCTLKMDHHCPWVANCVGYYNQKNFYQFLFCATFGNLIGFILLFIKLCVTDLSIEGNVQKGVKIVSPFQLMWYMWTPIQIFIGCLCAIAMTVSIGTLFNTQTRMLLYNQTTIETKLYPRFIESPFYDRNHKESFSSVMGFSFLEWVSLKFAGEDPFGYNIVKNYVNLEEC